MALEAPIELFDGLKWFWTSSFAGAGVTAITAGEWMASNVIMAKKVTPFTEHGSAVQTLTGGFTILLAGLHATSDVSNLRQQRAMGVGQLVTGLAMILKHWKTMGPLARTLSVLDVATGVIQLVFKPKARKVVATAAGTAAAAAGKK